MSFHNISFSNSGFVGLANYEKLFRDKFFLNALITAFFIWS